MGIIQDKIDQMTTFDENIEVIIMDLARQFEAEILDMNTDEQLLDEGIGSDDKKIVPIYRPKTITIKKQKGQTTKHVTLKDTGDFHRSFFINWSDTHFTISADDVKTLKLEKKYGVQMYGLTPESLDKLAELIRPGLINEFKNHVLQ